MYSFIGSFCYLLLALIFYWKIVSINYTQRMEATLINTSKEIKEEVYPTLAKEKVIGFQRPRQRVIIPKIKPHHELKSDPIIQQEKTTSNKTTRFQMRIPDLSFSSKNLNKSQFVKNISNALGNFFNPLINDLSNKERSLCVKLSLAVENQQNQSRMSSIKGLSYIQEEAKLQTVNQSVNLHTKLKSISVNKQKEKSFQQYKGDNKIDHEGQVKKEQKQPRLNKRRIIRKILRKPKIARRDHEQKKLVKQMEQNYGCKLKNNRLYIKGMPKKPVSSFFFFFKQYSKKIQEQNEQLETSKQLTYGSALAKRISKRWKEMTNEQKLPYQLLSNTTRQAYRKSMEEFKNQNKQVFDSFKKIKRVKANETRRIKIQRENQQGNQIQEIQVQDSGDNIKVENDIEPTEKKNELLRSDEEIQIMVAEDEDEKPKKKIPSRPLKQRFKSLHKPKSPSPSFFFYYNEKKLQISREHGVTRGAQITQIASEMWKKMSDEEKHPYEHMANERRKQYYEEMKRFEVDHPQEWAKMIAHRRRVTGGQFLKKNFENRARELEKIKDNEEENSESIEEQIQQIDSLEGNVIQKPNKSQPLVYDKSFSKIREEINNTQKEESKDKNRIQLQSHPKRIQRRNSASKSAKDDQNQSSKVVKQADDKKSHRPKAPVSSFFMFYRQNNSDLAQQFQQKNGGKLVQYASQIWRNMTESQKKPYEIQAQQSRQHYYKAMQIYKENYPEQVKQRKIDLKKKHAENLVALNEKHKTVQKKGESLDKIKLQSLDQKNKIICE